MKIYNTGYKQFDSEFFLKWFIKTVCKQTFLSIISHRGRYPALGHPMPWAVSFSFKWEENKYFSRDPYFFIFNSDQLNPNFVEKNSYSILFFLESYFLMSKVNFWMFGFIETKRLDIDSFTNENWNKFKCHRSKVFRGKQPRNRGRLS